MSLESRRAFSTSPTFPRGNIEVISTLVGGGGVFGIKGAPMTEADSLLNPQTEMHPISGPSYFLSACHRTSALDLMTKNPAVDSPSPAPNCTILTQIHVAGKSLISKNTVYLGDGKETKVGIKQL